MLKTVFSILFIVFFSLNVFPQYQTVVTLNSFSYEGVYYTFRHADMMNFINNTDMPMETKEKMKAHADQMKKDRTTAYAVLGVGTAIGLGLVYAGTSQSNYDANLGVDVPDPNYSIIGIGTLIGLASALYYTSKFPNDRDKYAFLNIFNQRMQEEKKIKIGFNYFPDETSPQNLALMLRF